MPAERGDRTLGAGLFTNNAYIRRRGVRRGMLCIAAGVVLAAGWLAYTRHASARLDAQAGVSPTDVAASLARGVAWIWPNSNGPQTGATRVVPYREAAVLVESLVLRADGSTERTARTAPLTLPAGVHILPVVHVESAADTAAELTPTQVDAILAAVRRQAATAVAGAGLLQLDFEAPLRQREAYRTLVAAVRNTLPAQVRLSVTVLAHWCTQGDWLDQLPVDEVVPMLYRLGPHADGWRRRFAQDAAGLAQRCRGPALGFATNDPPSPALLARATRPYWFDESAWSNPSRPPRYLVP